MNGQVREMQLREMVDKKIREETLALFKEVEDLFYARDFSLEEDQGWFQVRFSSDLGYQPLWPYAPLVRYSMLKKAWESRIKGVCFFTSPCPFFEFVCELRGYTLAGTVARDAVVLDVGPWNGISGFYFAARAARGRLIFLEPDQASARAIERDIGLNGFENCAVVKKALFHTTGRAGFIRKGGGQGMLALGAEAKDTVETITLADLIKEQSLDRIDFFKIDIEGAEIHIAEDLACFLEHSPASWAAVASYHDTEKGHASTVLEQIFQKHPGLFFKTVYPYHETTFVTHKDNAEVCDSLRRLPDCETGWAAIRRKKG